MNRPAIQNLSQAILDLFKLFDFKISAVVLYIEVVYTY